MITKKDAMQINKLKTTIQNNVAVNDSVVCSLCDELIEVAKNANDNESVAYAYIWRADNKFYVDSDLDAMKEELNYAQPYLKEDENSELIVKYFALLSLYYESIHDMQLAFQYSLKILKIAEALQLDERIGIQYGNIGSYFLSYECYEEAFQYTKQAIQHPIKNIRFLRPLFTNLITSYLHLKQPELAYAYILKLSKLPIPSEDLDIYVNCAKIEYYACLNEKDKVIFYYHEYLKNSVHNRLFEIDFLKVIFQSMMNIMNRELAEEVLQSLQLKIHKDETDLLVSFTKLKIQFAEKFLTPVAVQSLYKEFYIHYTASQRNNQKLTVKGLLNKYNLVNVSSKSKVSQKELQDMKHMAKYDALSKVYNRQYLKTLQNKIFHNKANKEIGMVMIDIDYFKEYNDYYGHPAGDDILRQIGNVLLQNVTDTMAPGRYGGDEFMVLCWNLTLEEIRNFVQAVQASILVLQLKHEKSHCSNQVTLSIGYGIQQNTNDTDSNILFENVDKAMYEAKSEGRNRAKAFHNL